MNIQRFSSRRHDLSQAFLAKRLHNARAYDRIAGYFRSSLLSLVGDTVDTVTGPIRVVCNSDLDIRDVETAQAARNALRQEWCASHPEIRYTNNKPQLMQLYNLLSTGYRKFIPRLTGTRK
jgi:hypothetical protein